MQQPLPEDELVERLSASRGDGAQGFGPTLQAIHAEIETLEQSLRVLPRDNPFASEPELAAALEQAARLADEPPVEPTTAEPPSAAPRELQPRFLGQYQLLEELGTGGMGTVYRAVHQKLNRTVALKVLPADRFKSPEAVARFEREMRAIGRLQHPNIVAAHDAGEVEGCHFLVMELVEGEDVGHLLSRIGPFPIAEACEIARQAALGLQHICDDGLVHRDIKPSNLMLAKPRHRKGQPTVKILDLGLALLEPSQLGTTRELTSTGQIMGTLDYMAPEQGLDTHHVDIRADLYSLGATLYKMLTGRAPLDDPRYNSVMKRLIALEREQPTPLNSLRPDCLLALCDLVQRLLSKSPDERPVQPQEVADELAPFATGANLQALLDRADDTLKLSPDSQPLAATLTDTPQSPTQIQARTRPAARATKPMVSRRARWLTLAVGLPLMVLLGTVIYVITDKGQVTIEAPDDLTETVSVSVLRNGAAAVPNWQIKPGENAHRIQTGTVEVKLPAGIADEFELQPLGDLVVRRGGEVAYRLTRRAPTPESTATSVESWTTPVRYALDFNYKLTPGRAHVVLPALLCPMEPCTVEMYVTPRSASETWDNRSLFVGNGGLLLKQLRKSWSWGGPRKAGDQFNRIEQLDGVIVDRRVHLAGVSTGKTLRLFVDGRLIGETPLIGEPLSPTGPCTLGGNVLELPEYNPLDAMIDEVRISGIARYESDFTPELQFQSDADTLALYHFDEGAGDVLKDSSGNNHHGKIVGAKWVRVGEPGASATGVFSQNYELDLSPKTDAGWARVEFSERLKLDDPLTVEMFVTPRTFSGSSLEPAASKELKRARSLFMLERGNVALDQADEWLRWFVYPEGVEHPDPPILLKHVSVQPGRRVHLAGVMTPDEMRLFIDGRLATRQKIDAALRADMGDVLLGAPTWSLTQQDKEPFDGTIDEVRISTAARYDRDFKVAARLTADADTWGLYHCDEGTGDVLKDSSGNNHHGKIVGAKWVRSGEPGASATGVLAADYELDLSPQADAGGARVTFSERLKLDDPLTVEMFVTPRSFTGRSVQPAIDKDLRRNRTLFDAGDGLVTLKQLDELWQWLVYPDVEPPRRGKEIEVNRKSVQLGRRVHLASVMTSKEIRLFVDGRLESRKDVTAPLHTEMGDVILGALNKANAVWEPFDGTIDEVRISTAARYDRDFKVASRLTADADTWGLYHCDEGSGDKLVDASGNNHHGRIVGAKWVRVDSAMDALPPPDYELDLSPKTDAGRAQVTFTERLKMDDPLTVEMFVTPRTFSRASLQPAAGDDLRLNRTLFSLGAANVKLKQLDKLWMWVIRPESALPPTSNADVAVYHSSVQPGRRVHLAGVMTPTEIRLFIDGRMESRKVLGTPLRPDMGTVVLGWHGVEPTWEPFDGTIDEVRISTTARYDRDFKVATRLTADADTWGLYHCDEGSGDVLQDSSGHNHHGTIVGATWVPRSSSAGSASPQQSSTGSPRYALDFSESLESGTPRVELPKMLNQGKPCTIEMSITPQKEGGKDRTFFAAQGRLTLRLWGKNSLDWSNELSPDPNQQRSVVTYGQVPVGRRIHVAGVSTGTQLRLYVDGYSMGKADNVSLPDFISRCDLGGTRSTASSKEPFGGLIDEARISTTARYDNDFTPPVRMQSDPDTLAYYDFHEGQGDVLHDRSGNGHHGQIIGAKWVRLGESGASATGVQMENYELDVSGKNEAGFARAVTSPEFPLDSPCTVELYATPRSLEDNYHGLFNVVLGMAFRQKSNVWEWAVIPDLPATGPIPLNDVARHRAAVVGRRVHLAGVTTESEIRLYVDGKLAEAVPLRGPLKKGSGKLVVGYDTKNEGFAPFDGTVDEVRISTIARYDRDFAPPARFEPDDKTWALYHCDEGSGTTLVDASGNRRHANVIGLLKWVRVGEPGASATGVLPLIPLKQEKTPVADAPGSPLSIPEPLPLDEWLPGRTVLTVAQDDSGQFKTITEALKALKPGQVVKVLDQGPYKEVLHIGGVPRDTGLISGRQTVIEVPAWQDANGQDIGFGVSIGPTDGFRLSGFALRAPPRAEYGGILVWNLPSGVVVEDCHFAPLDPQLPSASTLSTGLMVFRPIGPNAADTKPNIVRHCCFVRGNAGVGADDRSKPFVSFEHNYFRNSGIASTVRQFDVLRVRHNVFHNDDQLASVWLDKLQDVPQRLEFSNNTSTRRGLDFKDAGRQDVTARNNLSDEGILLRDERVSAELLETIRQHWTHDHNGFIRWYRLKSATDVLADPAYLSTDPTHVDFLRIPANGPYAMGGAGGDWPSYIGALPPGPAPADGDWFTRLRDRWLKEPSKQAAITPPIKIDEPPPLDDWLKGRTVLTVAQDGSGQFKTIGEALKALKPRQVVKVLDRGPYHEPLKLSNPPRDTGLISDAKTVLELRELPRARWKSSDGIDVYDGHRLNDLDGFRIHGLHFIFPTAADLVTAPGGFVCGGLKIERPSGLVLEQCRIEGRCDARTWDSVNLVFLEHGGPTPPCIRDCIIEGGLRFDSQNTPASLLAARNYLVKYSESRRESLKLFGTNYDQVAIRQNVFDGTATGSDLRLGNISRLAMLEVSNNILTSLRPIEVSPSVPKGRVVIQNNICTKPGVLEFQQVPQEQVEEAFRTWQVGHNCYPRLFDSGDVKTPFPKGEGDVPMRLTFLAHESTHPDYFRLPADSPLGNTGAGGDWPSYIGALPPGPAPKDGDWFTRLRERWLKELPKQAAIAPPIKIDEPPLLDEWLKGRTVLTVAQDGSGQFKTIQAALDELKSGQVVKVLDKGPYRESLRLTDPPVDIGLVSERQTVLEIADWMNYKVESSQFDYRHGHRIINPRGFRLSGFAVAGATITATNPHVGLYFEGSSDVTVEDCVVRILLAESSMTPEVIGVYFNGFGADPTRPVVARECAISGRLHAQGWPKMVASPVLLMRNFIQPKAYDTGILVNGQQRQVLIRNNVVKAEPLTTGIVIATKPEFVAPEIIDIANNTVVGAGFSQFNKAAFASGVTIRGNVLSSAFRFMQGAEAHPEVTDNWQIADNWYVIRPESDPDRAKLVYRRPDDPLITPRFLSENPNDPNFARLPAMPDGRTAGALPPGPAPADGDWFTRLRERWLKEPPK